jgi:hypothetical protein
MNSRSKKYHESRKANRDSKKGSASISGYDEQNEKTIKAPKQNPASPKKKVTKPISAGYDDTGGPNNSGKRSNDD